MLSIEKMAKAVTKQELHDLINSWENHELIINEAVNNLKCFNQLFDIALHSKHPRSWRAAWMIDKINDGKPELIKPFINRMVDRLNIETSSSKKRHFLKLISQHEIPAGNHPFLIDYCTDCFTSAGEPIAVRVYALQILYNITEKEPELKPEVLALIQHVMELNASAGIKSRGKKLGKKLQHEISRSGTTFT